MGTPAAAAAAAAANRDMGLVEEEAAEEEDRGLGLARSASRMLACCCLRFLEVRAFRASLAVTAGSTSFPSVDIRR